MLDRLKAIGFINQTDIDVVETLINSTYDDLGLIKSALNNEDYSTADSILGLMNATLNSIRTQIDDLQGEQGGAMGLDLSGAWLWIVIGIVIVIVVVFVVYLLMPSGKKRKYGSAYKPVVREGFMDKIGKIFSRSKKSKLKPIDRPAEFKPAYREGYQRVKSDFNYRKGKGQKIKGGFGSLKEKLKRKKKQKDMREFFGA